MGHGRRIVELDAQIPNSPDPDAILAALLEQRWVGYRNVGFYDHSLKLLSGISDQAQRLSMMASDLELRGSRWRSGILHVRSVVRSPVEDDGTDMSHHRIDAHRGYCNWWQRERRTVLGWPLLGAALVGIRFIQMVGAGSLARRLNPVCAFERFASAERYFDGHPHAVNQYNDMRHQWSRFRDVPIPEHLVRRPVAGRDIYVETDHFLGYVNSERDELTRRLISGDIPTQAEWDHHRQRAEQIDDRPGILKAALRQKLATGEAVPPTLARGEIQWALTRRWRWGIKWTIARVLRVGRSRLGRRLASRTLKI